MSRTPVNVTVTGAAGQIGYALLFRIASGHLLGPDVPVKLNLLEIPQAVKAAEGTAMELVDCAFPLLAGIDIHDNPKDGFDGANVALLVGARPRTAGMERGDLLAANGGIFKPQGEAINAHAADDIKVLVVGNPANTNALIAAAHAPDVPKSRFTAMTRLDHNRALGQLALEDRRPGQRDHQHDDLGQPLRDPVPGRVPRQDRRQERRRGRRTTRRGSRRTSSRPSPSAARRSSRPAASPRAASAANAALDHVHTWVNGTAEGDWTSMGVVSDGRYGVPEGLVSSFPVTTKDGEWRSSRAWTSTPSPAPASTPRSTELAEERDAVRELGLI